MRCAEPSGSGMPPPERYWVASQTDSATPASKSDVSTNLPLAGLGPMMQSGEDAREGEQTRSEVGDRKP